MLLEIKIKKTMKKVVIQNVNNWIISIRKNNALLNLIQQDNNDLIDKIYLYANDLSEPKYQFLIKKREDAGIKNLNDPSAFIEYLNTMNDVYNNIIITIQKEREKF